MEKNHINPITQRSALVNCYSTLAFIYHSISDGLKPFICMDTSRNLDNVEMDIYFAYTR